jgi:uncharacterized membrane protein YjjP (DUF1212 family)/uncharacterized membrane protein YjjB (DUF3815 family)
MPAPEPVPAHQAAHVPLQPALTTDGATPGGAPDTARIRRVLAVARRAGVVLLASGAQTSEVETALERFTGSLGVPGVEVSVTYSAVSLSYVAPGNLAPTTMLQLARDTPGDFARLADVAELLREVREGAVGLEGAEAGMDRIETVRVSGSRLVLLLAPAVSAAATAILFGGTPLDGLATFGVALVVTPLLAWLGASGIPPFFALLVGTAASTILAGAIAAVGLAVDAPLVMTAGLLRFLPGGALTSGVRDLIDQSVVSGTARLADAMMVGAGVASGALVGIAVAGAMGVELALDPVGVRSYGALPAGIAAAVAVGAYAVRLSVPRFALGWVALLGAVAWTIFSTDGLTAQAGTFVAAVVVGGAARVLARAYQAPTTLWIVPSILTLQPGLALVVALLAPSDAARFSGLWNAVLVAFLLGIGVAAGDIIVTSIRRVRRSVVEPAFGAVADGVQVFVVAPIERAAAPIGGLASRLTGDDAPGSSEDTPPTAPGSA